MTAADGLFLAIVWTALTGWVLVGAVVLDWLQRDRRPTVGRNTRRIDK